MNQLQLQYCASTYWFDCDDRTEAFAARAVQFSQQRAAAGLSESLSQEEIIARLQAGQIIQCGTSWDDQIRSKHGIEALQNAHRAAQAPVVMVRCNCGHTIPQTSVMSASLGSSCPECYDRLSD